MIRGMESVVEDGEPTVGGLIKVVFKAREQGGLQVGLELLRGNLVGELSVRWGPYMTRSW